MSSKKIVSKIISELKNDDNLALSFTDFLYILNCLTQTTHPLKVIHQFVSEQFSHMEIQWKHIEANVLQQIYINQLQYCSDPSQCRYSNSVTKSQDFPFSRQKNQQQNKPPKQINKNEKVNVSFSNLIKLQTSSLDEKTFHQQKPKAIKINTNTVVENIQSNLIKKLTNSQKLTKDLHSKNTNDSKTDHSNVQNSQQNIPASQQNEENFKKRQNQLNIFVADLQFKKQYFLTFQNNSQLQKIHVLNKKIESLKKILTRRLKKLFEHFSNENYDSKLSFQKNNKKLREMNLKIFLKYFKQIKDALQGLQFFNDETVSQRLKAGNLMNIFKVHGKNKKQISFEEFLQINFQLFIEVKNDSQSDDKISQQKQQLGILVDKKAQVESLTKLVKNFLRAKEIFYNQNIDKILNINFKLKLQKDFQKQLQLQNIVQERLKQAQKSKRKPSKIFKKFIDQSLEDYQTTRNQIHQSFLKRHQKQKIHSLNQRLIKTKNNKNRTTVSEKHGKSSQRSSSLKNIKNKLLSEAYFGDEIQQQIDYQQKPKTTPIKKNLFDQIIRQARQEEEDDLSSGIFRSRKIKSLSDLQNSKCKQRSKMNIKSFSSQKNLSKCKELKSIFSLPKITRLSQSQFQNQSITKTLDYLHQAIGKQEIPKIKKILQIDNPQKKRINALENKFLKEYFSQQSTQNAQKQTQQTKKENMESFLKKCKKFKEQNYQKFMKFS